MREHVINYVCVACQYIFGSSNYAVKITWESHWLSPPIAWWEQTRQLQKPFLPRQNNMEKWDAFSGTMWAGSVSPPTTQKKSANSMFFHIQKKGGLVLYLVTS